MYIAFYVILDIVFFRQLTPMMLLVFLLFAAGKYFIFLLLYLVDIRLFIFL